MISSMNYSSLLAILPGNGRGKKIFAYSLFIKTQLCVGYSSPIKRPSVEVL